MSLASSAGRMPRLVLVLPAVLLAGFAPGAADASPRAWATVNLCDTPATPDSMGVRAEMPGTGRPRRMYMRFRAQYVDGASWHTVRGTGISPWVFVGLVRRGSEQAGWTFGFDNPAPGTSFRTRGVVDFQWRAKRRRGTRKRVGWVVVKRRRAVTREGVTAVDGGDPPGTSLASCLIA
jgi:hypothetical protein